MEAQTSAQMRAARSNVIADFTSAGMPDEAFAMRIDETNSTIECALGDVHAAGA